MFAVVPPPHYAQRVVSDDPDEVSTWAARRDGHHSRVVQGTGPYGFEAAVLEGQRVLLGWGRTGLRQTLRARTERPMLHIPIEGPQHYSFGRQRIVVAPGAMVFVAPGTETSRHSDPGSLLAMDLDGAALATEVRARLAGSAQPWPQFPQAFEPRGPLRHAFGHAIAELVRALDPGRPSTPRAHCESRVIATLADTLLCRSENRANGRLAAQRVADLEAWIDEHLADAITMGRLCEVAQVSERSLQLSFQARRGMSPMRFVYERRLAAAQRRISHAEPGDDITGIASSLGFTHLGRFSLAYREAFGEPPSRTILRSRGGGAARHATPFG
jgi:AraC-like DNA-binding protein